MDADLQDPPELLPDMLIKMDEGMDVVYAQRLAGPEMPSLSGCFAPSSTGCSRDLRISTCPLDSGDFRLISRRVRGPPRGDARKAPLHPRNGQLGGLPPGPCFLQS